MKKIIMALLFTAAATVTAFAGNAHPSNDKVLLAFNTLFSMAEKVSWSQIPQTDLYHANFEYRNERLDAYFNEDGELMATTRYISSKQLPLAVNMAIQQYFSGYEVMPQIIEYNGEGSTCYYVTLSGTKQDLIIKAGGNGGTTVFKKIKKDS